MLSRIRCRKLDRQCEVVLVPSCPPVRELSRSACDLRYWRPTLRALSKRSVSAVVRIIGYTSNYCRGVRRVFGQVRFAEFELDLHGYELHESGNAIKLQLQPAKVLVLLASNPGKLVTREEIRTNVWCNDTFVDFEQALNFCVRRIRSALRDDANQPRFLETLPRRGYRFIAPVCRVSQESSLAFRHPIRLAIVPLEELSSRDQRDYFAPGLAEEMIGVLSRLSPEHLRVISAASGIAGQQARMDLGRLRRQLRIDYVLRGSIRRSAERIDSPILLPVRGRCLTKMLPVSKRWDGNNEEATEHGSETGADRSRG
jgi:DNA-binding winged helix-turn-helix (wHTH) protein